MLWCARNYINLLFQQAVSLVRFNMQLLANVCRLGFQWWVHYQGCKAAAPNFFGTRDRFLWKTSFPRRRMGDIWGMTIVHWIYCPRYFVIITWTPPQTMRRQAPEAEDPCSRALPCSTWLASARGAHTSLCPLPQLISCPLHPHLPSLGGEGSLSLRYAEIESSWIGLLVWLGLSRRFSCLCVFTQKREPRPLGWRKVGPSPPPHRWCWSARNHERDTSCLLGGWSSPVQESQSTISLL